MLSEWLIQKYYRRRYRQGVQEGREIGYREGLMKTMDKIRQEGVEEGRQMEYQRWVEWDLRRIDAAAANKPFHEYPPARPTPMKPPPDDKLP